MREPIFFYLDFCCTINFQQPGNKGKKPIMKQKYQQWFSQKKKSFQHKTQQTRFWMNSFVVFVCECVFFCCSQSVRLICLIHKIKKERSYCGAARFNCKNALHCECFHLETVFFYFYHFCYLVSISFSLLLEHSFIFSLLILHSIRHFFFTSLHCIHFLRCA